MNGIDQALFLWLNLVPDAPGWLLEAARAISLQWPHWMVAATLAVALTGRPPWRAQYTLFRLSPFPALPGPVRS